MDVREKIILGSIEIMKIKGVRKTTMDSIATHIGVSKRTIYENFTDKKELVHSIVRYQIDKSDKNIQEVEAQSKDTIEGLFMMLAAVEQESESHTNIDLEIKLHYPEIFEIELVTHYNNMYNNIVKGLQRGIAQGDILEDVNLGFSVFAMMETVYALMHNPERMITITQVTPKEAFRYVMINFFRGIATPQGIQKIDKIIRSK